MREPRHLARQAWILLVVMTAAVLGGPIGFGAILRGGARPDWPPDRPVEWAALLGICGLVVALMALSVAVAVANQRAARRLRGRDDAEPPAV